MNKCIKITLNKCFEIDKKNIKDTNKPYLHLNMKTAKEIIKEANLKSCHACNKSSDMWKEYYFNNRWEAQSELNNIDNEIINIEIEKEYNKRLKKIKDKTKLQNQNYLNKVKKTAKKHIERKMLMNIEKQIVKKDKEIYGKNYENVIQATTKLIMQNYNTSNVGSLDQQLVQNNWKRDKEKILNYECRIPQYKKDTPFYIYNNNYILSNKYGYFVELSFFSKSGYKKYNLKNGTRLKFQIDKLDGNKKTTINKIINGEYKQGSAQIKISNKDKIELTISYSFEAETKALDKNRILGIDLGIVNVATMSIWDNNKENWDYINYKHNLLSGQELIRFRQKLFNIGMTNKQINDEIQKYNENLHQRQLNKFNIGSISGLLINKYRNTIDKRNKELGIASKCVGNGRQGHGYNNRMKPLEKIRKKVGDFADTFNHKYSRYIVDFAIKNNCGIIQMENLSGATQLTHEKFLKDWSYYDLQNKIEYKAKEVGIDVIYINPKYTSKRCSKCGCINEENRDCKNNQSKFKCVVCGHEENADVNASKNIAIPNIDEIIKEQF
ncbi:RNA-guided endonuclease InsQ/TnpB family protein [Clostridium brassicae]|uniref:Transposase n=1 Tax=Clostridium brassicae TaxID=2999072 RepID=A0ABT4D7M7_9CLOT|nr:transposase [Clostridium brassicae]MCY6958302.1 transposase [Clostridium brassicae]